MTRIVLAALLATGCARAGAVEEAGAPVPDEAVPVRGEGDCDAAPAQGLIGRAATPELGQEALRLTRARTLRWIQPGGVVTMDYRTDRLNVELDAGNRVTGMRCG